MMTTTQPVRIVLFLTLAVARGILLVTPKPVQSYVVGDGNINQCGNSNILSRFDFQCKLLMMVGRTPNTEMREFQLHSLCS